MNRKELKFAAKHTVRRHYMKLVFICLLAAFLGVEYGNTLELFNAYRVAQVAPDYISDEQLENLKTDLTPANGLGGVWSDILSGNITKGFETVQERLRALKNSDVHIGDIELGHSRGVLASLVNMFTSGELLTLTFTMVDTITESTTQTVVILAVVGFVIAFSFRVFVLNVFEVIMKRLFLEARIYDNLPASRFLFLLRIRKWMAAALSMLLYSIVSALSAMLIIPFPFVNYTYFLTPYLVAENPSLSPIMAMRLSRQMMKGHRMEAFKLEASLFPWVLLSLATAGLSGLFFSNAYIESVLAEYYASVRALYLEDAEIARYLTDPYLFRHAEPEKLQTAYAETVAMMHTPVIIPERSGFWGFLSRNFGIIHSYDNEELLYRKAVRQHLQIDEYRDIVEGKTYPDRLSLLSERHRKHITPNTDYMRHYSIPSIVLMFFISSFIGWCWEVTLHLVEYGTFINRGVLHGPWLPIYGSGGLLILLVLYRLRSRPHIEFIAAVVLSGIVEYGTSVALEMRYGQKWWDYSGYFLNLNGRICAEGLLVFGIAGVVFVYLIAPTIDDEISRIKASVIWPVSIALLLTFVCDNIYSRNNPNTGEGITDISAGGSVSAPMSEIATTSDVPKQN